MVIHIGAKPTPPPAKPGLIFNHENHSYRMNKATNSPEYMRVSGVTGIINQTLNKPKLVDYKINAVARAVRENLPQVLSWHSDLLQDKLNMFDFDRRLVSLANRERDHAARRGTAIHDATEKISTGKSATIKKNLQRPVMNFQRWQDENHAEVLLSERPCGNRSLWYAGTFDAIVKFHAGDHAGETWLVDYKTSKSAHGETCIQAAAYANAQFYVDEDNRDQPMPSVDKIGLLHLTDDDAHLYWLGDLERATEEFMAVLLLHSTTIRRDKLIRK